MRHPAKWWTGRNAPTPRVSPADAAAHGLFEKPQIPVQAIIDNFEGGCSAEEIAGPDIYPELSVDVVRRILAFAGLP